MCKLAGPNHPDLRAKLMIRGAAHAVSPMKPRAPPAVIR